MSSPPPAVSVVTSQTAGVKPTNAPFVAIAARDFELKPSDMNSSDMQPSGEGKVGAVREEEA